MRKNRGRREVETDRTFRVNREWSRSRGESVRGRQQRERRDRGSRERKRGR